MAAITQLKISFVAFNLGLSKNFADTIPGVLAVLLHEALETHVLTTSSSGQSPKGLR